jgi:hypothetical protein
MQKIYLLWHTHTDERLAGGEDSKLLGTFSSRELAEKAQTEAALLSGFKDHLDDFEIAEYEIDKREWQEGFHTETWGSDENRYFVGELGFWIVIDNTVKTTLNYEYRSLMVLAKNEAEALALFEKNASEYGAPYKNVYGQNVCSIFDTVHFVKESWFFNTQDLDKGTVIEVDSRVKSKKIPHTLELPKLPSGDGLYDLLALWQRFAEHYADTETSIFEWQNDLDARHLIEKKLALLDPQSKTYFLKTSGLKRMDKLVLAKTFEIQDCIWGEAVEKENGYNRKANWYYYRINQAVFEGEKGRFGKK